jgi:UDP-galactopyranose mutase
MAPAVAVVNYPNDNAYTRVTEYKHLTGQEHPTKTSITFEYPQAEGDPYYPVPMPKTRSFTENTSNWLTSSKMCFLSAVWEPTVITTWTRSSRRL